MQCNCKCNLLFTSSRFIRFLFSQTCIPSLFRVFYALRTVHITPVTSHQHAPQHGYKAVAGQCSTGSYLLRRNLHPVPTKSVEKLERWNMPYGLFQTTGEMCAKFGSDRFRNVDLYKVQTNIQTSKQTNLYLYI
jgi:hypothetical protein